MESITGERDVYYVCFLGVEDRSGTDDIGDTTMDENDPTNARKRRKELMSGRKRASTNDTRSNPRVPLNELLTYNPLNGSLPPLSLSNTSSTQTYNIAGLSTRSAHPQPTIHNRMPLLDITICRVSQMQQQHTNLVTTPFPFGLNRSPTLGNSIVSQRPLLSNTISNANRTQRLPNSSDFVATRGRLTIYLS
ncbi:hypothetical protein Tco_1177435 [Tanacetum coccineum]